MSATRNRAGHHRGWRARLRAHLFVQSLESRLAPAQFIVTSSADSGAGSLRAAIAASNTNNEADTITFDPAVTTINLTTGQLTISENKDLLIDGSGTVTVNGAATASATNRIFNLVPSGQPTISFQGLTLAKGNTIGEGGAINCEFGSTAAQLTLVNCKLQGCTVSESGGAIYFTKGVLSINNCTLDRNSSGPGTNFSSHAGGAIYASGNVTVTLNKSTVSNNVAPAVGIAQGGGIYAGGCHIDLTDCSILNNTAPNSYGGGMEIYQSVATLTNCTVAGNSAGTVYVGGAGGLDLYGNSTATLTNCTIANNVSSFVGGIFSDGPITIRNCTIASNTSGGTGSGGLFYSGYSIPQVDSSIIANNIGFFNRPDIYATTIIGSNNLFGAVSGIIIQGTNNPSLIGSTNNRVDPGLLPLGDYGGPTLTMPLRYNSVAIDKGANPLALPFDQRGLPRVSANGLADIGAVEGAVLVPFVFKVGAFPTAKNGATAYAFTVTYDGPTGIEVASLDGSDIIVAGPHPVGVVSVSNVTLSGNQAKVTYQFAPPGGSWDKFDVGTYVAVLAAGQVLDPSGKSIPAQGLGKFLVNIPGTYTVDSIGDQTDGDLGPGQFTLREAIQFASAEGTSSDTINFDPSVFGTAKAIALASQLNVTGTVIINGPGSEWLTLSGNGTTRLLSGGSITVTGMTLIAGNAFGNGGAINAASVIAIACVFQNNTASAYGGAVYATSLTANYCVFRDNVAKIGGGALSTTNGAAFFKSALIGNSAMNGGAIHSRGPVTIADSTITGNQAVQLGGGLYTAYNVVTISTTTINGNSAKAGGGAFTSSSTGTFENSTISGNTATSNGGGIYSKGNYASLTIRNSTVTANSASVFGGGLFRATTNGAMMIQGAIIARNFNSNSPDMSFNAPTNIAGDNNLIGVADTGNMTLTGLNNLTGTLADPLDPMLAPLANYGGPTPTHALLPGSPAINAGSAIAGITTDQRGYLRTYGTAPDIGAYEAQPPRIASVKVNDGSSQRSRVTSLTVNFDSAVTLPAIPNSAFQLRRQGDGLQVRLSATVSNVPTTTVTLWFVGEATDFGSLMDGRYTLTVLGSKVSNFISALDGNADAIPGDDYVLIGTPANRLFRLFGDSDGDGAVAANDFIQLRLSLASTNMIFDFNGDGYVSSNDFLQFRMRFGGNV